MLLRRLAWRRLAGRYRMQLPLRKPLQDVLCASQRQTPEAHFSDARRTTSAPGRVRNDPYRALQSPGPQERIASAAAERRLNQNHGAAQADEQPVASEEGMPARWCAGPVGRQIAASTFDDRREQLAILFRVSAAVTRRSNDKGAHTCSQRPPVRRAVDAEGSATHHDYPRACQVRSEILCKLRSFEGRAARAYDRYSRAYWDASGQKQGRGRLRQVRRTAREPRSLQECHFH